MNYDKKTEQRVANMGYVNIEPEELAGKTVLDIGTAYGIWSALAHKAGATVTSTDIRDKWESVFKKNMRKAGMKSPKLTRSDIQDINPEEWEHDVVFLMAVLHHLPEWERGMDNAFKCARELIFLDVAIDNPKRQKGKRFLELRKGWSWVPTEKELDREIKRRGGKILDKTYGYRSGCDRVFVKVKL